MLLWVCFKVSVTSYQGSCSEALLFEGNLIWLIDANLRSMSRVRIDGEIIDWISTKLSREFLGVRKGSILNSFCKFPINLRNLLELLWILENSWHFFNAPLNLALANSREVLWISKKRHPLADSREIFGVPVNVLCKLTRKNATFFPRILGILFSENLSLSREIPRFLCTFLYRNNVWLDLTKIIDWHPKGWSLEKHVDRRLLPATNVSLLNDICFLKNRDCNGLLFFFFLKEKWKPQRINVFRDLPLTFVAGKENTYRIYCMHCARSWKIMQHHARSCKLRGKWNSRPLGYSTNLLMFTSYVLWGSYVRRDTLVVKMTALLTLYCEH